MKSFFVEDLKDQSRIIDFYMVKTSDIRVDSRKREYLDVTLGDKTGEVTSKKWDIQYGEKAFLMSLKSGDIVKVDAGINLWQGNVQLKINKIRLLNDEDVIELSDFIKTAPESSESMYNYILDKAMNMEDEDFRNLAVTILEDNKEKLMYYPAASKNHHAEYGGLLYHMKRMIMSAEAQCNVYPILKRDLLYTGVIIHDMEKINEIDANEYGISSGYSMEGQMLGHIVQGVREIDKRCERLEISREKAIMLEHMILSHHYEPDFGSPKKPLFPEAEMLHYLDIVDARMFDIEEALKGVDQGIFSERVRVLDNRKMYNPTF